SGSREIVNGSPSGILIEIGYCTAGYSAQRLLQLPSIFQASKLARREPTLRQKIRLRFEPGPLKSNLCTVSQVPPLLVVMFCNVEPEQTVRRRSGPQVGSV